MAARKDITPGEKFGRLTVIGEAPKRATSNLRRAFAQCECGSVKDYGMAMLRCGNTRSCGCLQQDPALVPKIGDRYGKLTVVDGVTISRQKRFIHCMCDCGNLVSVRPVELYNGHTKSCGCGKLSGLDNTIHGYTGSRTHRSWSSMHERCRNPKNKRWADYGGRGIKVCPEWGDFQTFLADMGEAPDGHTLDRYPDLNGNYRPDNCRWATPKQQANNTRRNRILEFDGQRLNISQWSERIGIHQDVLGERLRRGWTVERTLTQPKRSK